MPPPADTQLLAECNRLLGMSSAKGVREAKARVEGCGGCAPALLCKAYARLLLQECHAKAPGARRAALEACLASAEAGLASQPRCVGLLLIRVRVHHLRALTAWELQQGDAPRHRGATPPPPLPAEAALWAALRQAASGTLHAVRAKQAQPYTDVLEDEKQDYFTPAGPPGPARPDGRAERTIVVNWAGIETEIEKRCPSCAPERACAFRSRAPAQSESCGGDVVRAVAARGG